MKEYIELGPSPWGEECVPVKSGTDYLPAMLAECDRYKRQLERDFAIPDDMNARYAIKKFPHDFGTYAEVVIFFDDEDEAASEFAYDLESHLPERWEIK